MNNDLVRFATKTKNAHIAIVDKDHYSRRAHFERAQRQLESMIERASRSEMKIRLVNGTVLYFCDAPHYEYLKGWRFDRIETVPSALPLMPEHFLAMRLKPGIAPSEGIAFSQDECDLHERLKRIGSADTGWLTLAIREHFGVWPAELGSHAATDFSHLDAHSVEAQPSIEKQE